MQQGERMHLSFSTVSCSKSRDEHLTSEELDVLKFGFNMTWPTKPKELYFKTEAEALFTQIENKADLTEEKLDRVKTKMKSFCNSTLR